MYLLDSATIFSDSSMKSRVFWPPLRQNWVKFFNKIKAPATLKGLARFVVTVLAVARHFVTHWHNETLIIIIALVELTTSNFLVRSFCGRWRATAKAKDF